MLPFWFFWLAIMTCLTDAILSADRDTRGSFLWIDDSAGNIGQVNVTTGTVVAGSVHNTGLGGNLTDIGFIGWWRRRHKTGLG
jgi:hypothetical protein